GVVHRANDVARELFRGDAGRRHCQMDHGGSADSEFEIAADSTAQHGGFSDSGYSAGCPDAGRLADIYRKGSGRVGFHYGKGILRRVDALVREDGGRHLAADVRQPLNVTRRYRLFGEVDVELLQTANHGHCLRGSPRAVGVDPETDCGPDGFANGTYAGDVLLGINAHLDLHGFESLLECPSRDLSRTLRLNTGDGPLGSNKLPHRAAQQTIDRQTGNLAEDIPQRHFQSRLGEGMAGQGATHTRGQQLDVARVLTGERRLEDGANEVSRGDLVLSAPSWSARNLSQPVYTIVGMDLDQQEG